MSTLQKNISFLSCMNTARISLALMASLTLTACIDTSFLRSDTDPSRSSAESGADSATSTATSPVSGAASAVTQLMSDARYAWDLGNMERAENLYGQATKNEALSQGEKNEAWQRYALSSAYNGRPHTALDALEQWNAIVPGAEDTALWQDAWLSSMRNLSAVSMQDRAEKIWKAEQRSADVRAMAAMLLVGRAWSATQSMEALPLLRAFYEKQDMLRKQNVERITAEEVRHIPDSVLLELNQKLIGTANFAYPANIILLEDGRRGLGLDAATLAKAGDAALFVDKALAQNILTGQSVGAVTLSGNTPPALALPRGTTSSLPPSSSATTNQGAGNQGTALPLAPTQEGICLVLALPQKGAVGTVTQKIRAGAEAAVTSLGTQGRQVNLQYVDTSVPQWITQMQALPLNCAVVGGPILAQNVSLAKSSGATVQRNFFTFLPSLDAQDEGIHAWRLFPSPQDQVAALIEFSRQMAVHDFASFFPADTYGTRMNGVFASAVRASGGTVRAEGYTGTGASAWTAAAQSLLKPQQVGKAMFPTTNFGATFMPDSWKNMDGIVSAFAAQGETRQLLLGTTIWGQSLGTGPVADAQKFALAVFPSAYNPAQKVPALQSIAAQGMWDMWTALGHDFVQLGANLGLQSVAPASLMNTKLQVAQSFNSAMAPVTWNGQGKASQKLYVLSIDPQGVGLADPNVMAQRRAAALANFETKKASAQ